MTDIRPALIATGDAAATHLKTAMRYKDALEAIQSCYPKNSNAHRIAEQALKETRS